MNTLKAYHILRAHGHWSRLDSFRYALWLAGWDWTDVAGMLAALTGTILLIVEYWNALGGAKR